MGSDGNANSLTTRRPCPAPKLEAPQSSLMLWFVLLAVVVLWTVGMITSYTLGGVLHVLLLVGIVLLILQLQSELRHGVRN